MQFYKILQKLLHRHEAYSVKLFLFPDTYGPYKYGPYKTCEKSVIGIADI